jgi:effector-binding domain-containing protein
MHMLDKPKITRTTEQLTAMIHLTVPRSEIRAVMGPGLEEVKAVVAAQSVPVTGPWFTHHLRMDPKIFDFEICLPVGKPVSAAGRVRPGKIAARKVARAVYQGDYEGLGAAWGELNAWIKAEGLKPASDVWEICAVGPEMNPDPSAWRTELYQPLVE